MTTRQLLFLKNYSSRAKIDKMKQRFADALNRIAGLFYWLAREGETADSWGDRHGWLLRIGDSLENRADGFDVRLQEKLRNALSESDTTKNDSR